MTAQETADFYFELSGIYGSPHADNREEIEKSIEYIRLALSNPNNTPEMLRLKTQQLAAAGGSFKSKFSSQIISRFWDRELVPMIRPRKFIYD